MTPKLKFFLAAVLFGLPLDLLSKEWIARTLTYSDRVPVIEGFFYLTHVRNPGAAFGMFASSPAVLRLTFFISVTLVAIGLIFSFYRKLAPRDRFAALSLGLILSGAVGNLLDRIRYGEVVDFLHFILPGGYIWPDFNFADSLIVVGVIFLVLELFAVEGETHEEGAIAEGES
jgi:signal peptidase II